MRSLYLGLVMTVFIILGASVYLMRPIETVVFFDAQVLKAELIRQLAEHKASSEQIGRTAERFKESLKTLLAQYATKHSVVIFERHMVLAGGRDITLEIASELSQAMRKGG